MINARLSRIELFAFSCRPSFMHISEPYGCWYGVLKLTFGGQISYGNCILCAGDNAVDLIKWGSFLKEICHCTVEEATEYVRMHGQEWAPNQLNMIKTALDSMFIQNDQIRMKVGAGSERYRHQRTEQRIHSINTAKSHLNPTILFAESVSYYSLL
ncbi:hypothetical protein [Paenibacillus silagei]|uniref:Uncharacterized protein n=1 Tax=Paenibacillus silagei TaxID=1670801 RepID=A0ABS4NRV8_9BACL|nr:hypothetical protein [Paenibacillus silagei]MBP2112793.1 hypothetical protein [Paenibacillus silagei]